MEIRRNGSFSFVLFESFVVNKSYDHEKYQKHEIGKYPTLRRLRLE